jgi:hypothetical protein
MVTRAPRRRIPLRRILRGLFERSSTAKRMDGISRADENRQSS